MSISNFGGKLGMQGVNTLVDIDIDETIYGNNDRIDGSLGTSQWPLPLLFRFGLSKTFVVSPIMQFLVAIDAIHPNNNPEYLNIGLEYTLMDMVSLRIGKSHTFYNLGDSNNIVGPQHGLSFGTGIKYQIPRGPLLKVDYVFSEFGVFNNVQGYSISLNF
jgi:hypothetical protein